MFCVVAGSVSAIVVITGNTGKRFPETFSNAPPQVYKPEHPQKLSASDQRAVWDVSLRFIGSAVAREHLDDSYGLVSANLREGLSKTAWRTGNIPVVPYAVQRILQVSIALSFANDVAYDVVLIGKRGTIPRSKTFLIELKRFPNVRQGRWLVDLWEPVGLSNDTPSEVANAGAPPPPEKPALSAIWLLIPAGILGLVVLVPLGVFSRNWYLGRRARLAYVREREAAQTSTTSPS